MSFISSVLGTAKEVMFSQEPVANLPDRVLHIRKVFVDTVYYINGCVGFLSAGVGAGLVCSSRNLCEKGAKEEGVHQRTGYACLGLSWMCYLADEKLSWYSDKIAQVLSDRQLPKN